MLKIEKIRKLLDGTFFVGFSDKDSGEAIMTLRLTYGNIQELHNAAIE